MGRLWLYAVAVYMLMIWCSAVLVYLWCSEKLCPDLIQGNLFSSELISGLKQREESDTALHLL